MSVDFGIIAALEVERKTVCAALGIGSEERCYKPRTRRRKTFSVRGRATC